MNEGARKRFEKLCAVKGVIENRPLRERRCMPRELTQEEIEEAERLMEEIDAEEYELLSKEEQDYYDYLQSQIE